MTTEEIYEINKLLVADTRVEYKGEFFFKKEIDMHKKEDKYIRLAYNNLVHWITQERLGKDYLMVNNKFTKLHYVTVSGHIYSEDAYY